MITCKLQSAQAVIVLNGVIVMRASGMQDKFVEMVSRFGLQFVLKHVEWQELREVPRFPSSLCPSHPLALPLVTEMLDQVIRLSPASRHVHIGADEVSIHPMYVYRWSKSVATRDVFKYLLFLYRKVCPPGVSEITLILALSVN